MKILRAISDGLWQAVAAPRVLLLLWLVNVLFALPVSLMIREALADSFGKSLVSRQMRDGFDLGWHAEFESRAGGFESTFGPTVSGPGPVYGNLESWWSGELFTAYPPLVGLGVGYAVLWALLLGGVLDHLARPGGKLTLERFFMAGGKYFTRFLGLLAISGVLYFLIYRLGLALYGWIEAASRDVTVEKTVYTRVLLASALIVSLLAVVRMIFDYAKIATVAEDRRNILGSAWAGLRFVLRHPLATLGVMVGFAVLGGSLFALYAWLAPGAGQSTLATVIAAFLFSQLYLVTRLAVRVGLLSGEMGLYQSLGTDGGS